MTRKLIAVRRAPTTWLWVLAALISARALAAEPLPGTAPLDLARDDAVVHARCMQQVTEYFERRIDEASGLRDRQWQPDFTSPERYEKSVAPHRARLRRMLGLVDAKARVDGAAAERIAEGTHCCIERITVPMFDGLSARGLMFSPTVGRIANPSYPAARPVVVVCPDADTWPERFAGLANGSEPPRWLRGLVAKRVTVFVAQSIERLEDHPYCQTTHNKTRRMILYRLGYPVGRTMPGLDVQDVTATIDYLTARPDLDPDRIGIVGVGQGGMTALYAAAIDRRISAAVVADYFQVRDRGWEEPVDRRLCGQLLEFGDAELAGLVAPRPLGIVRSGEVSMSIERVMPEVERALRFYRRLGVPDKVASVSVAEGEDAFRRSVSLLADGLELPGEQVEMAWPEARIPEADARTRRDLHFEERLKCLRRLITDSEAKREARWKLTNGRPADFERVKTDMLKDYRQLVGTVPTGDVPLNPKTELALVGDGYKLYRITLDVTEGVEVCGNLLIPENIRGRAAAVICQHGLSGTPEMTTGLGMTRDTAYHEFARRLAEHGYVAFAPYLMQRKTDEINMLVRQAGAVGMMRVAMPVAKTRRIVDFLETLPFVDAGSIGYYGLSYGGYSAIWISPLEPRLAAVVISGHFNDWRTKITSDAKPTSYLRHPDEDFYNWNILHRFTHPELIAMIAPRPVCVEFAERDGITTPEWTAYAWDQVVAWRDRFGFADRIALAHFDGVHEIHAVEAVDFLDRFLRPSRPVGRDYGRMRFADGSTTRYPHAAEANEPFVTHVLDSAAESGFAGRFWVPTGARELRGMAVKLCRVGEPGPLEVRFGFRPGRDDAGTARVEARHVSANAEPPWHALRIEPHAVSGGDLVYYEFRCLEGKAPGNQYVVYGPRPIGGKDFADRFALSYRVLTDRPRDALP